MHAEARRCIDLADGPAHVLVRLGDIGAEEIDAGDVQTDGQGSTHRHLTVVGVHLIGHIDRGAACRQVAGRAQEDDLTVGRHAALLVAILRQQTLGLVVDLDARQHLFVTDAAARVGVGDVDKLADGVLAVTDDMARDPFGDGDQLAVDHQHAMVVAGDETLDDDATTVLVGVAEGGGNVLVVHEVQRRAAAVVGVERLDHDGKTDALRRLHRGLRGPHDALLRNR